MPVTFKHTDGNTYKLDENGQPVNVQDGTAPGLASRNDVIKQLKKLQADADKQAAAAEQANNNKTTTFGGKKYTKKDGNWVDENGRPVDPSTVPQLEAAKPDPAMGTIDEESKQTQSNIKQGLGSAMTNATFTAMSVGARDPTSPSKENLADKQDEAATEFQNRAQRETQEGNRNIYARASEEAGAAAAAENAQNVRNLQGAAGGGAAALARGTKAPEIRQVAQDQANLRKTGADLQEKGEAHKQAAQLTRIEVAKGDAQARNARELGLRADAIAAGAPDEAPPEEAPPEEAPDEEVPGEAPAEEAPGEAPAEEAPGEPPAEEAAAPEGGGGNNQQEEDKEANDRVTHALEGLNADDKFADGVAAFKAGDAAWAAWATKVNKELGIENDPKKRIGMKRGSAQKGGDPTATTNFTPEGATVRTEDKTPGATLGGSIPKEGSAHGGYTGEGGKYEPAGVVHKGEYVIPKEGVDQKTKKPDLDFVKKIVSDYRVKHRTRNITRAIRRRF
jgi:hypothetical protein